MKAAIVLEAGQAPTYGDFEEPVATAGEEHITVTAAAVSPLVRGRASGQHYSASNLFPFVVGVDGVGRRDDGRRVYFAMPRAPFGSMAERVVVPSVQCCLLDDDIDDITAAAIANPGMSSWAAFTERARLKPGETVLINGATGTAGRLAVQIAKHLGAGKVIASGRNRDALAAITSLGADETISLAADAGTLNEALHRHFEGGVDVVLDYLWGESARSILLAAARTARDAVPIRFVQVGSASGPEIVLPAAVLRSSAIEMMGSGIGSVSIERLVGAIGELMKAAVPGGFAIAATPAPLADVARVWAEGGTAARIVLRPQA